MNKYDPYLETCLICSSKNIFKFHESSDGSQIYKCRDCKIQFMNPQCSDEFLNNLYANYTKDEPSSFEGLSQSHLDCLLMIEKFCPSKGALLDIGSGNGNLISLAQKRGWISTGYDVDCETVRKISAKINVKMYCGKFEELNLEENSYDVITMLHVIEHLKNPIVYLDVIKKVLKQNGILFIALPNIQSRSGIVKLFLEKLYIKRKNVAAHYDTSHHLWYYTPMTIRNTLNAHGFNVNLIYSGRKAELHHNRLQRGITEKIISKIAWPSNMALIAVKK